jgi:hypothetical protein
MRRLITYFNSLLLGVILGMIFVTIVDEPSSHLEQKVGANGFTIGCEILAITNQTTVLQIAGTTMQLIHLPAEFCASLADHLYRASSSIIVRPVSLVRPARSQQPRRLRH